jgi:hypothetical protein
MGAGSFAAAGLGVGGAGVSACATTGFSSLAELIDRPGEPVDAEARFGVVGADGAALVPGGAAGLGGVGAIVRVCSGAVAFRGRLASSPSDSGAADSSHR